MPFLLDRRQFLRSSVALGALTVRGLADAKNARIALLSDTHIAADKQDRFRGFSPHENLRQACTQLNEFRPDLLLVNGDLARKTGESADYAALCEYLNPLSQRMPLVVSIGNHDDRKNARAALTSRKGDLQPVEQKLVSTLDAGPVQLILLDSLLATNIAPGQLGHSQREWLRNYLQTQTGKPIIVFVHHNPDPEDDHGLVDASALLSILQPDRRVKAIIFGHTHVYRLAQLDRLHLVNLPAVGYNFTDGVPVGWVEAEFSGAGASIRLRTVANPEPGAAETQRLPWR